MDRNNIIQESRARAVEILLAKADKSNPVLIDYQLDDYLRLILNLPDRPLGDMPYVGWMVGEASDASVGMTTSKVGLQLIKKWEGYRAEAYLCPANVWTVGYGHTRTVKPGMCINRSTAEKLLQDDLKVYEKAVNDYVKVTITQNQFDALVSFTYNCGVAAFKGSTLLRLLNQQQYNKAASQFPRWNKGGGRVLSGLTKRRYEEQKLFLK